MHAMNVDTGLGDDVRAVQFGELQHDGPRADERRNLDLLLDVPIPVTVEVGGTRMTLDEVLALVPGSVVRLDKKAEDPIDLRVNGKLVARGEVVMVDDSYGLRITRIVDPRERLESLR
ncbi:MAG: flagellar motor switch protein FliN [Planctomycetes bacterium]|nr:flagellar motor switch protein FliN [Planctomycetota bacterium]